MLRVYALSCGSLEFEKNLFFPASAAGERIVAPVSSYLIVHPKGKLLFDTGIHCDALADPVGRLGKRIASLFAIHSRAGRRRRRPARGPGRQARRHPLRRQFALSLRPLRLQRLVPARAVPGAARRAGGRARRAEALQREGLGPPARLPGNRRRARRVRRRQLVLLPTPGHTAGHQSLWIRASGATQFVLDRGRLLYARAPREDDSAHAMPTTRRR